MASHHPTQAEIAQALNLSQSRVSKMARKGMPLDSIEAATEWRKKHQPKKKSGGMRKLPRKSEKARKEAPPIPMVEAPKRTGDGLTDALAEAAAVREQAYVAFQHAVKHDPWGTSQRISEHTRSVQAYITAEAACRKEQEIRGVLVPKQQLLEHCRRALDMVLRRIKRLAIENGPQCNPTDPIMATKVLERAVDQLLAVGEKALKELR